MVVMLGVLTGLAAFHFSYRALDLVLYSRKLMVQVQEELIANAADYDNEAFADARRAMRLDPYFHARH